jgi:hypothetical protein
MRSVCDKRSSSRELSIELTTGIIPIFAMLLAIMIMGPVAALERPVPLLLLQLHSTTFNVEVLTVLKHVELTIICYLPNLPWRQVDAQRREGVVGR